jgi:hypothetical protein
MFLIASPGLPPEPDSCNCRRHSHSCGGMSNRPRSPIGRPWGAARWAGPLTRLGQAQDALGPARPVGLPVELRPSIPPGQPTLAYDAGITHLCRWMSDKPQRPPLWTVLGSGPLVRSSGSDPS